VCECVCDCVSISPSTSGLYGGMNDGEDSLLTEVLLR
jgi:hypothetical protein